MHLRKAEFDDWKKLLDWRNDPVSRNNSFDAFCARGGSKKPIPPSNAQPKKLSLTSLLYSTAITIALQPRL